MNFDRENYYKKWNHSYRGVDIEIGYRNERYYDGYKMGGWNYYLILRVESIPESVRELWWLKSEHSYMESIAADLDWHGGITYYEKKLNPDSADRFIKIGCDYSHFYDENITYTLESVKIDAENTAKRFLEFVPNYLVRCNTVGGYHLPSDGVFSSNGQFVSNKGIAWHKQNWPDNTDFWWEK